MHAVLFELGDRVRDEEPSRIGHALVEALHVVVAEQLDGDHREELRFCLKALCDERRAPARVVAVTRGVERVEALSDRVAELDGDVLERLDLEAREVVKVPAAFEHAQERVDVRLDLLEGPPRAQRYTAGSLLV